MTESIPNTDYAVLLEHSFAMVNKDSTAGEAKSRLHYLSDAIFDFTTYDSEMAEFFAIKAVEMCRAISDGTTFDYIADPGTYRWYIILCNTPFFSKRLDWGTSIRGAWWDHCGTKLHSCGLYIGGEQLLDLAFTSEGWIRFIDAVIQFAAPDMAELAKRTMDTPFQDIVVDRTYTQPQQHRLHFILDIYDGMDSLSQAAIEAGNGFALYGARPPYSQALIDLCAAPWIAAAMEGEWEGDTEAQAIADLDRVMAESLASLGCFYAALSPPMVFSDALQPISTARKDGTAYLGQLNDNLHEVREDLRRYNGCWMVIWHPGLADDGFDFGWSVPMMGAGGWPDAWIRGVIELPWNSKTHWEMHSEKTGG